MDTATPRPHLTMVVPGLLPHVEAAPAPSARLRVLTNPPPSRGGPRGLTLWPVNQRPPPQCEQQAALLYAAVDQFAREIGEHVVPRYHATA